MPRDTVGRDGFKLEKLPEYLGQIVAGAKFMIEFVASHLWLGQYSGGAIKKAIEHEGSQRDTEHNLRD